jgi:hypothetical protein
MQWVMELPIRAMAQPVQHFDNRYIKKSKVVNDYLAFFIKASLTAFFFG